MKQIFLLSIFTFLFLTPCLVQAQPSQSIEAERSQPFDINEYKGWRKIDLGSFSLYAPKGFIGSKQRAVDAVTWKYENDNSELNIYSGEYAPKPGNSEQSSPNFQQKFWINDETSPRIIIHIWSYESKEGDFRFKKAARFTFNGLNGKAVIINLSSKDQQSNEIAEKIFRSVKFNPKDFLGAALSAPIEKPDSKAVITLERGICFGSCPAYKLTISSDGAVTFEGYKFVKNIGMVTNSLSQEKVQQLIAEFDKAKYFSLKDKYRTREDGCPEVWTDNPNAFTSIKLNGKYKSIDHYYGCQENKGTSVYPKALTELENKIDEIVGTEKWIK